MSEPTSPATTPYLPTMSLHDYQQHMKENHPQVAELLDPERLSALDGAPWLAVGNEFDDDAGNGRGGSYRRAQRVDGARRHGITRILTELGGPSMKGLGAVLDVLGGDGLLTRVWRGLTGTPRDVPVPLITGDISARMVQSALAADLPAVRQQAHSLLHRSSTLDGVVLAYGTHHLSDPERAGATREAHRVLRDNGRLVLHDFDESSAVARWFSDVVAPLSRAGHPYRHFTAREMRGYLEEAGFADIRVGRMYDPIVAEGGSEDAALTSLAHYMADMYGLALVTEDAPEDTAREQVLGLLRETFRYSSRELPADSPQAVRELTVRCRDGRFLAELPRVALLATATKTTATGSLTAPRSGTRAEGGPP